MILIIVAGIAYAVRRREDEEINEEINGEQA